MTTVCKQCKVGFTFEPAPTRRTGMKPSFCESCKLEKRQAFGRAQVQKRKDYATSLGLDSARIGLMLESITLRTHKEVGQILGISTESSRITERRALAKIRKFFKLDLLGKQIDNSLRSHNEHQR